MDSCKQGRNFLTSWRGPVGVLSVMRVSHNTFNSSVQEPQRGIFSRFGQDALLFLSLVLWVGWVCALFSYSRSDHAWSSASVVGKSVKPANWLGQAGAYLADVSYFLLGFSVWVLALVLLVYWLRFFRSWIRGGQGVRDENLLLVRLWTRRILLIAGVVALLAACAVLEWTRLYSLESQLPNHSGGVLGYWVGPLMVRWLGYTGSTVVALVLALLLTSWVLGFSWGRVAERTGATLEKWIDRIRLWSERSRDARVGRQAQKEREARTQVPSMVQPRVKDPLDQPQEHHQGADDYDEAFAADGVTHVANAAHAANVPHALTAAAGREPVMTDMRASAVEAAQVVASAAATSLEDDLPWDAAPAAVSASPVSSVAASATAGAAGVRAEPVWDAPLPSRVNATTLVKTQPVVRQKHLFDDSRSSALPSTNLLDPIKAKQETVTPETLEMTSRLIEKKLKDFGVEVRVVEALPGPVVTRYEIEPATGVKGSQIVNLSKDLARSLSLMSIRVVETIPGKNYMALELPNARRQTIQLREVLSAPVYEDSKSVLTVGLGKDIVGEPVVADLAKMPHCLVAGTTGSGKSVGINAMILSILYKAEPKDVRMLMIDPKMLEMAIYEGIPHLLAPVVTDMKQAAHGLNWCVAEMERRYKLMSKLGVRNLAGYNSKIKAAQEAGEHIGNPFSLTPEDPEPLDELPHIVIIIDELADLMMVVGKKIEELIARLAQKARAAGIHLILATQRPSVDVITGLIKANVPTRIAFQVSSKIDSRTILDQMGAEALLGMGDMLYMKGGTGQPVRVHGAFVSDDEVLRVVEFLKEQGEPDYIDGVLEGVSSESESDWAMDFEGGAGGAGAEKDPMYDQAVEVVLKDRKASISYVQRKLRIGYNRAARLLEDMEAAGLVSGLTSSGQRDILVPARHE